MNKYDAPFDFVDKMSQALLKVQICFIVSIILSAYF
jgi:hypothetical protein